jgi:glycosyltransferase involved in cell wall biosynthesis
MRSVFNQSYPLIELLVIDDCSTDTTFEHVKRFAANPKFTDRFDKFDVSRTARNMGAHHALNLGIAAASGEFVTFLNSDDAYEPERLQLLISHYNPAEEKYLAFTAVKLVNARGESVVGHELNEILERAPKALAAQLPSLSFAFLRYQLTGSTGNIFLNRSLLDEVGTYAPLRYCHDWDFMLRAITICEPVLVAETFYRYRIHGGNSFAKLQELAVADTNAVLSSYYGRVVRGLVRNTRAPTPGNWPYVFEMFARMFGVYDAWLREASYLPQYARRQTLLHGTFVTDD